MPRDVHASCRSPAQRMHGERKPNYRSLGNRIALPMHSPSVIPSRAARHARPLRAAPLARAPGVRLLLVGRLSRRLASARHPELVSRRSCRGAELPGAQSRLRQKSTKAVCKTAAARAKGMKQTCLSLYFLASRGMFAHFHETVNTPLEGIPRHV